MHPDEYQTQARSHAIYPHQGSNLTYPALGLAGEASELLEKVLTGASEHDISAELGDVLWYVANLAAEAQLTLSQITETTALPTGTPGADTLEDAARLVIAAGRCSELVKKAIRDDNGTLTDTRQDALRAGLSAVLTAAGSVASDYLTSLDTVAASNLDKLNGRAERGTLTGSGDHR